jgi:hypothetical protein
MFLFCLGSNTPLDLLMAGCVFLPQLHSHCTSNFLFVMAILPASPGPLPVVVLRSLSRLEDVRGLIVVVVCIRCRSNLVAW